MFDILRFIETKRDGGNNGAEDLKVFVRSIMEGSVRDYHVAAWLMAVYLNGMAEDELLAFTDALANSGEVVSFGRGVKTVDKHSTGGVGDKATLILVPLVAACGLSVAKLSGRGLGFTGGTVDKLESIPGFKVDMTLEEFKSQVEEIGCAVAGHSPDLAPAEAFFYELRDVTATVPSLPLICSSIVSKKIAGGADSFVFDVKYGSGAFMSDLEDAKKLAESLVNLSNKMGHPSSALLTSMDEPLGKWIGNSMEVLESVEVLKNSGPEDTTELCLALAGEMLLNGGMVTSPEAGVEMARSALVEGRGLKKLAELVVRQGGPADLVDYPSKYLQPSPLVYELKAQGDGFISSVNTRFIGEGIRRLGGGRSDKEESIDPGAALEITVKIGDKVKTGDVIMKCYSDDPSSVDYAREYLDRSWTVDVEAVRPPLILGRVD
ncbi:thymidine phosphorylase [Dethiosulfovibrio salsuginis]|uniref:Pyrimidine-nucleoside phosphorylase n=1 Tax=Dethiosulfovibrio salsuginis TaxID=561720 RepID=A0A1X7I487_9BACT|nr:thymidine phosphorylase [Dethiosulfovibrio salsuginis]SMG08620.1 pyrimidine-nucleoside phosphorylase [Dethiosulfovibrio salsuginis]